MQITGATRFIAHIGYPTSSFRAPLIYNPYFAARAVDCVIVPIGCDAGAFTELVSALSKTTNCIGALVTMPNKILAAKIADRASSAVEICGSANALRFEGDGTVVADMFDGEGFARGLEVKGRAVADASVFLIGAGGVGSAIAAALAARGIAKLRLSDIEQRNAEQLAERLAHHYPTLAVTVGVTDPSGCDIVVNASPLGMEPGDPLPIDATRLSEAMIVGDVVLTEVMTPLLVAAAGRGCRVQTGLEMLFEQIPAYLEFFGLPSATSNELRAIANVEDDASSATR